MSSHPNRSQMHWRKSLIFGGGSKVPVTLLTLSGGGHKSKACMLYGEVRIDNLVKKRALSFEEQKQQTR